MGHYLQNQFQEQIIDSVEEFEELGLNEEEVGLILKKGVEISDPHSNPQRIAGESLHDARRKEPITVHVDLRDILSGSSSVIAGAAISNPYLSGLVLLLTFTAIGLPDKHDITPYQALTYGVGWELVEDKNTFVDKTELIDKVVDRSQEISVIEDMDEQTVETTLQELDTLKCVEMKEANGDVLVWFREEFDVKYS